MKLKEDLENVFQGWQEKIESRNVDSNDLLNAHASRLIIGKQIFNHRDSLQQAIVETGDEKFKQQLTMLIEELDQYGTQLSEKHPNFISFGYGVINEQKRLWLKNYKVS